MEARQHHIQAAALVGLPSTSIAALQRTLPQGTAHTARLSDCESLLSVDLKGMLGPGIPAAEGKRDAKDHDE